MEMIVINFPLHSNWKFLINVCNGENTTRLLFGFN